MTSVDPDVACKDVDFAIMVSAEHDGPGCSMPSPRYRVHPPRLLPATLPSQVGGFPRKAGMERKDVMAKNVTIYRDQASALAKHASKDVKVSVAPTHLPQSWPRMLHVPPPRISSPHGPHTHPCSHTPCTLSLPPSRCLWLPTLPKPMRSSSRSTRPTSPLRT